MAIDVLLHRPRNLSDAISKGSIGRKLRKKSSSKGSRHDIPVAPIPITSSLFFGFHLLRSYSG